MGIGDREDCYTSPEARHFCHMALPRGDGLVPANTDFVAVTSLMVPDLGQLQMTCVNSTEKPSRVSNDRQHLHGAEMSWNNK